MKKILIPVIVLALTLVAGCAVMSIYPYYTAKNLTTDPALLGIWVDPTKSNANEESWTFEQVDKQTYKLIVPEKSETNEFDAHLFKLKEQAFLDLLPRARPEFTAPSHFLLRVDSLQPRLEMRALDYDWLGKLVETNSAAIRHTIIPNPAGDSDGGSLLLTADTAELQTFVLKHLETKAAWGDPMVMKHQ